MRLSFSFEKLFKKFIFSLLEEFQFSGLV